MMSKRIILTVSNDLVTDQRVNKVAETMYSNGYDVLLTGRKLTHSLPFRKPYSSKRFRLIFNKGALFYAELNLRLFFFLIFSKVDIIYSNDTDTLVACYAASKIRRKRLIFDAHELFPEVPELQNRQKVKKVWQKIEDAIFPHLKTSITVCQSISDYYHQKYGIKMHVIKNVPKLSEVTEKKIVIPGKKIILYQGAVNMGRGLEWVIDAMQFVQNAVLYIIGDGDILGKLKQKVKNLDLESIVIFHGRVSGEELQTYTSSGDIGLCLLENKGLSYYYSLPNRVFSYLHADVPILASPYPEISAVVGTHNTGVLTEETEPAKLASVINKMLANPLDTSHFSELKKIYCWEEEEKKLLKVISDW